MVWLGFAVFLFALDFADKISLHSFPLDSLAHSVALYFCSGFTGTFYTGLTFACSATTAMTGYIYDFIDGYAVERACFYLFHLDFCRRFSLALKRCLTATQFQLVACM